MAVSKLVTDPSGVVKNIEEFDSEVKSSALREMLAYVRHWYAVDVPGKGWIFGPSKFIGYADMTAKRYAKEFEQMDGRITEKNLEQWFVELDNKAPLAQKLAVEIRASLALHGKSLNSLARVHVLKESEALRKFSRKKKTEVLSRITFDADMLAGKPCIRGMRIRVSDVLELLAHGATRQEILDDFPYLEDEDISASLEFAVGAVDHRVIRAA